MELLKTTTDVKGKTIASISKLQGSYETHESNVDIIFTDDTCIRIEIAGCESDLSLRVADGSNMALADKVSLGLIELKITPVHRNSESCLNELVNLYGKNEVKTLIMAQINAM